MDLSIIYLYQEAGMQMMHSSVHVFSLRILLVIERVRCGMSSTVLLKSTSSA